MIPYISQNNLAEFCDGFCESTAFSPDEIDYIFTQAKSAGLKIKLHTEQFNNIGGLDIALKHNAISVDHLEVVRDIDLEKISNSDTVAVLLPGVSFFLDYNYAPAVELIKNNAAVALATDYNPGSSNISNIGLILSSASIKMKMKIEEVISAYTINAAKALNLQNDRGSIEQNKKADLAVFNTDDYADLIYNVAENKNWMTIKNGNVIYSAKEIN
jgi:imidazolonepropionase